MIISFLCVGSRNYVIFLWDIGMNFNLFYLLCDLQEHPELAVKSFVSCIHNQTNDKRAKLLFDMLEPMVENHVIPAK